MTLSISPRLEELFSVLLNDTPAPRLAEEVLKLSDHFVHNHGARTPWRDHHTLRAYAAYFLPLNVARLQAAWREVGRFLRAEEIHEIWDFGSGLGALHWMLEEQRDFNPRPLVCVEADERAIERHRELSREFAGRWHPEFNSRREPRSGALAVFSFSYLEMRDNLPDLSEFSHILIVEPSFRDTGRALMKARAYWIEHGLTPLAPCTHSGPCPLLEHSERDWCHQRIHFKASDRFLKLESHLPMKNQTLTYSYLLVSRAGQTPAWRGATRVIGDTLFEKGKVRQLICRGPEREFLSWLSRAGEPPRIPHGALIADLGEVDVKGNELRPRAHLAWQE